MSLNNYIINQEEIKKYIKEEAEKVEFKINLRDDRNISVTVLNIGELTSLLQDIINRQKDITSRYKKRLNEFTIVTNKIKDNITKIKELDSSILLNLENINTLDQKIEEDLNKWYEIEKKLNKETKVFFTTLKSEIPRYVSQIILASLEITEYCVLQKVTIIIDDTDCIGDLWHIEVLKKNALESIKIAHSIAVKNCPETKDVVTRLYPGDKLILKYNSVSKTKKTVYYNIEFFK